MWVLRITKTMYSIFFTINSVYFPFGKIFLRSLYEKVDMDKVERVFVSDTGLLPDQKEFILSFDKVNIIENASGIKVHDFGGPWSKSWHQNVSSKTITLRKIASNNTPIVMIDADCMFVKDISSIVDLHYDIQICDRPAKRATKTKSNCIGSFISINNEKSLSFLDRWIDNMNSIKKIPLNKAPGKSRPKESKCLSMVFDSEFSKEFRIKVHSEAEVSARPLDYFLNPLPDTKIVHFKGRSSAVDFDGRFCGIEKMLDRQGLDRYIK